VFSNNVIIGLLKRKNIRVGSYPVIEIEAGKILMGLEQGSANIFPHRPNFRLRGHMFFMIFLQVCCQCVEAINHKYMSRAASPLNFTYKHGRLQQPEKSTSSNMAIHMNRHVTRKDMQVNNSTGKVAQCQYS
jgi:hypothetical protein